MDVMPMEKISPSLFSHCNSNTTSGRTDTTADLVQWQILTKQSSL